ncbi:MAG: cupin-like domain-containing protein [Pseudomonadota bacterium]
MSLHLPADFAQDGFPTEPTPFRHALADHPLLQLDALADLARRLDGDRVEYNSGRLEPGQNPDTIASVDLEPADVVRQIETCGAWMVLKSVEVVPDYREILNTCLSDAARACGHATTDDAGFYDIQGFIFVASANSVTPFHVDYEENLFVHLKGPKAMHVFDNRGRSFVSEEYLETYPGKHRNLAYDAAFEQNARIFDFEPGDGLYVPYTWPHWVRTGDDVAVSMAITWKTRPVLRNNTLMFANAVLRRMKLPQPAPGRFPLFDGLKIAAFGAARAVIEPLRRSERSRRLLRGLLFGRKANYYYDKRPQAAGE